MKKPPLIERLIILGLILTVIPIGSTQIGWYYFGREAGMNFGMTGGVVAVTVAAYLMYQMGWRDADDDE